MSQLLLQYQDYPAGVRVETWPSATYIAVSALTFSGSYLIKPQHDTAAQSAHLVMHRNVLSWHFILEPDGHRGASLLIHCGPLVEVNTAASTWIWRSYALFSGDTGGIPANNMQGLRLPSIYCYFELVAGEANLTVNGYLKLETPS